YYTSALQQELARFLPYRYRTSSAHDTRRVLEVGHRGRLTGRRKEAGGVQRLQGEGWRPAVLGTGGIQEDRMPGASDRQSFWRGKRADAGFPVAACGGRIAAG